MDYARLALLKAEELEKKENAEAVLSRAGLAPDCSVAAGADYKLCDISGSSNAALIVSLTLSGGGGTAGNGGKGGEPAQVELRLAKKTVMSRPYQDNMLFMTTIALSGSIAVSLRVSTAIKVVSADIMLIGGEIAAATSGDVKMTEFLGKSAAVYAEDGRIRLSISDGVPDLSDYVLAGFGDRAAVAGLSCDDKNYLAVCFCQSDGGTMDGQLRLSLFTPDGRFAGSALLSIYGRAISIMSCETYLVLGYVYRGEAYAAVVAPPDFSPQLSVMIDSALSLEFVRGTNPPAVFLERTTGSVLRLPQEETPSEECISLYLSGEVS